MRHSRSKKILNMPSSQREAVMKNLFVSMLNCGRIETTLAKAKFFVPNFEKLITKAKSGDSVAVKRYLLSKLNNDWKNVGLIMELSKKFADKKGGYTRIIKTWQRYGDAAKTAIVEFAF